MSFKEIPIQKKQLLELGQDLGSLKIDLILESFYEKLKEDLLVGFFFDGKDIKAIASKQSQFLKRAMGLTQSYEGTPPAAAHHKLAPILEGHYDRRLVILENTLVEFGLSPEQVQVWLGFENAFREGIIQQNQRS